MEVDARRALQAAALVCALALTSCTTDQPADPPSPTPTPASQTPTETAQERQERLDYAAAEKSYRAFRAEYNRVLRAGGAKKPTTLMKATAGGPYLAAFAEVIEGYKAAGSHDLGRERVVSVRAGGYGPKALLLNVCEDSRDVVVVRKSGQNSRGELRSAKLEVRLVGGTWRVWDGDGKVEKSCP